MQTPRRLLSLLLGCLALTASEAVSLPPWPEVLARYREQIAQPLPAPDPQRQRGDPATWAWTAHAKAFVHPPRLHWPATAGAARYQVVIGGRTLETATAQVDLTPLWAGLAAGEHAMQVTALAADGTVIGQPVTGRKFQRKILLAGERWPQRLDYRDAALRCLRAVLRDQPEVAALRQHGRIGDIKGQTIKIAGGIALAGAALAMHGADEAERAAALAIGVKAGEHLLTHTFPAGSFLAGMPVANRTQDIAIWGGEACLDLHAAGGGQRFLDAAIAWGERYAASMHAEGWWPGYIDSGSGQPVAKLREVACVPGYIVVFLDRLVREHGQEQLRPTLDRAAAWLLEHPVKSYLWEAQFDDMGFSGDYVNLTGRDAVLTAQHLLRQPGKDAERLRMATALLAFGDCQFASRSGDGIVVKEQYHFQAVNQTNMRAALGHALAWRAGGDPVQLALALEMANPLLKRQWPNGMLDTYLKSGDGATKWINCPVASARDLLAFAAILDGGAAP